MTLVFFRLWRRGNPKEVEALRLEAGEAIRDDAEPGPSRLQVIEYFPFGEISDGYRAQIALFRRFETSILVLKRNQVRLGSSKDGKTIAL